MSLVSLERWLKPPGGDFQLPVQKTTSPCCLRAAAGTSGTCAEGQARPLWRSLLQGQSPSQLHCRPSPRPQQERGLRISGDLSEIYVGQPSVPSQTESLQQSSHTLCTQRLNVPRHFLLHMLSPGRPGGDPQQPGC